MPTDGSCASETPGAVGRVLDAGERRAEVLLDVDGERAERRDVEDARALLRGRRRLGRQPVDRPQERGERLARSGGREDQRVVARARSSPSRRAGPAWARRTWRRTTRGPRGRRRRASRGHRTRTSRTSGEPPLGCGRCSVLPERTVRELVLAVARDRRRGGRRGPPRVGRRRRPPHRPRRPRPVRRPGAPATRWCWSAGSWSRRGSRSAR